MTTEEAKIWNHHLRQDYQAKLRHLKTRQGRFDAAMLHFGHPVIPGGPELEASDHGWGATMIYCHCEGTPRWLRLYREVFARLTPQGKRIVEALEIDWRSAVAARIAGVSRTTVYRWKKRLPRLFAECYEAYCRRND